MYLEVKEDKNKPNLEEVPSFVELRQQGQNFPEKKADQTREAKSSNLRRTINILVVLLILAGIGFFIWRLIGLSNLYSNFKQVQLTCANLKTSLSEKDLNKLNKNLEDCQKEISTASQKLEQINKSSLNIFKGTTQPLAEVLTAFNNLAGDFKEAAYLLKNLSDNFSGASDQKNKNFDPKLLTQFFEVSQRLEKHNSELKDILNRDNFIIRYLKKKLSPQLEVLEKANTDLRANLANLEIFRKLFGFDREKAYLVVFQNSSELRPTGGFWGSYGILKIKSGSISSFTTDDVYHLDVNCIGQKNMTKPPEVLAKFLKIKEWCLRDANWSPNFPDSANMGQYLYYLESHDTQKLDGVLALTPSLVEDLLSLVGPIKVDDMYFDRENFLSQLQYQVEMGYKQKDITEWNRKDILNQLASQILDKLKGNLSLTTLKDLSEIFQNSLIKKDIMFYANDQAVQNELVKRNWAGTIQDAPDDYLFIVDANLASYKTDLFIDRRVSYRLEKKSKANNDYDLVAHLEIKYQHSGSFDWKTTRYRTYTRIYLPLGSQLISSTGAVLDDKKYTPSKPDVYTEFDKTVFGAFIAIEPKSGGTLTFEYLLPQRIKDSLNQGNYQLVLQKQPGVNQKSLSLSVDLGKKPVKVSQFEADQVLVENKLMVNDLNWLKDYYLRLDYLLDK
jgi:hypothetical protein